MYTLIQRARWLDLIDTARVVHGVDVPYPHFGEEEGHHPAIDLPPPPPNLPGGSAKICVPGAGIEAEKVLYLTPDDPSFARWDKTPRS